MTTINSAATGFEHEAVLYGGEREFLERTVPFIVEGVARHEPVMVAVSARKIDLLQANLGWDRHWVDFVEMGPLGANPARIIPAWRRFVADHPEEPSLRGIGEPVWPGRSPAELEECRNHELLLNAAFDAGRSWQLLCPYDTNTLDDDVLDGACHTHPRIRRDGSGFASESYPASPYGAVLHGSLPEPTGPIEEMEVDRGSIGDVPAFVRTAAARLDAAQVDRLVRACREVTDNTIRHGGGRGRLRAWHDDSDVVIECRDGGRISDPLVGRDLPPIGGRPLHGLALVHLLCDLVQLRSSEVGTVARLTVRGG